ncbi:MAG: glycosyltransferase family protein [Lachnospiraceae bacterium]|nr:glycosyltransferase family protein [Lachnospiraceae bacterium]
MKENKICFIICVNNQRCLEENLLYLNRLIVPEGYEVDIITIEGAKSMTSGYNEGMQASDAKYKIYMHQDVFITDIYFLQEMIDIFTIDPKIGMIGMVGTEKLPEDGIMWNADRSFAVYCKYNLDIENCCTYRKPTGDDIVMAQAIDGLLMATQYDIPWREDIFTDWDFYDTSQSMEFLKAGYYVVVPQLDKPMCVHDDGYILKLENYEDNRLKFLKEYEAYLKG